MVPVELNDALVVLKRLACIDVRWSRLSKRVRSLMVIRTSVAPQVLGLTPRGSEYSRIYRRCTFSGRRYSHRQRCVYGDFVNLKDLPAQSSKMLIDVGFACVHS
jgi:hypothetical protein